MNLLVLSNNPDSPSFRQRIGSHLGALADAGILCDVVRLPKGSWSRGKLFKRAARYDAVLLHKKRLNFLDASRLRRCGAKVIYDFDDAVMFDPRRPEKDLASRRKPFARTVALAALVIAGNDYLAEHARRYNERVAVLPTGLAAAEYLPRFDRAAGETTRLVWIGTKSTLNYLRGLSNVLEEIGRRFPGVVLRIVCDDFFELKHMRVEKRRWSLETQADDLAEADIGLAPLPDNRFTRGKCGFKVLQYSAAGLPTVASPVGVNARYVRDGETGFHAHDSTQWVDKIARLVENPPLRVQMGRKARADVEAGFDLAALGKRLAELIKESA